MGLILFIFWGTILFLIIRVFGYVKADFKADNAKNAFWAEMYIFMPKISRERAADIISYDYVQEIIADYEKGNLISSDARYLGKKMLAFGKVTSVNYGRIDIRAVTFCKNQYREIYESFAAETSCLFSTNKNSQLASISVGYEIFVEGKMASRPTDHRNMELKDCEIIDLPEKLKALIRDYHERRDTVQRIKDKGLDF